jgi:hypothetical protein
MSGKTFLKCAFLNIMKEFTEGLGTIKNMILAFVSQDHALHVPRWLRLNASVVTNHQNYSAVATRCGHVDQSVGILWDVGGMHVLKYVTRGCAHLALKQVSRAVSVGNRKYFDLVLLQIGSVNR